MLSTPSFNIRHPRKRKQDEENYDRYISRRANSFESWGDVSFVSSASDSPGTKEYSTMLKSALGLKKRKVLNFETVIERTKNDPFLNYFDDQKADKNKATKNSFRNISNSAYKVLDAPDIVTDMYRTLTDWSKNNILTVALGSTVYLWNATEQTIDELVTFDDLNTVTSVKFCTVSPNLLTVCTENGCVMIYDIIKKKMARKYKNIQSINVCAWKKAILTTGSKDSTILLRDIRIKDSIIQSLKNHTDEVCALEWNNSGKLASSSCDSTISIFDIKTSKVDTLLGHKSTVTDLAWNPLQTNMLGSCGNLNDKTIKLWNVSTGKLLSSRKVSNGVTGLHFSKYSKELCASVGKTVQLFTYNKELRLGKTLQSHDDKILGLCIAPNGSSIVSSGADETLCFWKIFENNKTQRTLKPSTPQYVSHRLR